MELKPIYQRVIGLDVHQAKISACAGPSSFRVESNDHNSWS